jgi:energy-coupling factor transporter ATP-binding protein EcfA2
MHLQNANEGAQLTDQQLWEFLKHFYILGYDFDSETGSAVTLLKSLISQSSTDDPSLVWAKIVNEVKFFNQSAGTLSLDTLPIEILQLFNRKVSSYWAYDIEKLQDHGNYILSGIRSSIGGVSVKRSDFFAKLQDLCEENKFIFVTGERGCGKSSLIKEFAEYLEDKAPIFCLRTEEFDRAHLDNVFSAIGLKSRLSDLEAGFVLMPKKYLLIESLEKLLELENSAAFSDLLHFVKKGDGWTIIASGRDYAYQQISFNYLQPSGIKYSTLTIGGFSDNDIQQICEKLEILKSFVNNSSLKPLLKNPFYADLAYRVALSGATFSAGAGEKEFKDTVWRNIISKESERSNGMPLKRRQTFIEISVRRAKQMVYGVSDKEFDPEALLRLEADDLIHRNSPDNLVNPAHDILEDWALENFIEGKFKSPIRDINTFLSTVGHEPAMNRAFRLWLYQKLKYGENIKQLILDILGDKEIENCWRDETITAVLLSEKPYEFLNELRGQLFKDDCDLLKRFFFILRISCKIPDQELTKQLSYGESEKLGILRLSSKI